MKQFHVLYYVTLLFAGAHNEFPKHGQRHLLQQGACFYLNELRVHFSYIVS